MMMFVFNTLNDDEDMSGLSIGSSDDAGMMSLGSLKSDGKSIGTNATDATDASLFF